LSLAAESLDEQGVGAEFGIEDFEGYGATEKQVLRPVDQRHAAAINEMSYLIPV
jgi:hypothetical protein